MARKTVIHNPAFLDDSELFDSFAARQADLDWVIKGIKGAPRGDGRHLLIYGPRGAGKTMLVRRVAAELRRDPELSEKWHPVVLPEEINHVGTPGEFWLEVLIQLAQETHLGLLTEAIDQLMDEQDESALSRRALKELVEYGLSAGKRILLIVENFNRLIDKQMRVEGARVLLDTLAIQPGIVLLATATMLPPEIGDADGKLHGYFQSRKLEPLTENACGRIWSVVTGVEPDEGRTKALKRITGGNARLLTIISRFGSEKSLKALMDELVYLVDEHTAYFKNMIDSLSLTEGKVFHALAEIWDPATSRQVARIARYDTSTTSSYLAQLVDKGLVEVLQERRRKKSYQLTERMYNIYYLLRRSSDASERVKNLIRFMILAYGPEKLARIIFDEATELQSDARDTHRTAFEEILLSAPDTATREKILSSIPQNLAEWQNTAQGEGLESRPQVSEAFQAIETEILENLSKSRTGGLSSILKAEDMMPIAEEAAADNPDAWSRVARIWKTCFINGGKADAAFVKSLTLKHDQYELWVELAEFRHRDLSHYEEAKSAYKEALALNKENADVWAKLGDLLFDNLKLYSEAEQAYIQSLKRELNAWVYIRLADLYSNQMSRISDAERILRHLIKLKPRYINGWEHLGELICENYQDFEGAAQLYRKATTFRPKSSQLWTLLGSILYYKLKRIDEAEEAYRNALNSKGNKWFALALLNLVRLLIRERGRAEEAFQLAVEGIDEKVDEFPEDAHSWASTQALIANEFAEFGSDMYLPQADVWINNALKVRPDLAIYQVIAAFIYIRCGKVTEALEAANRYMANPSPEEHFIENSIQLLTEIAAAGYAKEALLLLKDSSKTEVLEPLLVGLRLFVGEDVQAPVEVVEVAQDIVARIEKRSAEVDSRAGGDEPSE